MAVFQSRDFSLTVLVVSVTLKLFSLICMCLFFYFIFFIICTFELLIKECMTTILEVSTLGKVFYIVVHNEACPFIFSPFPHDEERRPSLVHTASA